MKNVGVIAAQSLDRWSWWRQALKDPTIVGRSLPVHPSEPEFGYYRTRRKGEDWQPVGIYPDDDGVMLAFRNGEPVEPDEVWSWCCRNPVSYDDYVKALDGGGFADEPKAAPGIGDNSGEADPFDALTIELAGEKEMAADFLKNEVTTQSQADKAGIWAKRLTDLAKRADNLRVVEKEPHLAASRAVDDKWREPIADAKDWGAKLKRHVEPFLIAEKRKAEEVARKAREEADKQRAAADELAQSGYTAEAEQAIQAAQEADKQAETRNASAGRTGARVSVRVEKVGVVADYAKAAAALVAMNHPDIKAEIDRLAQRAAKAGMPFDGMEVKEVEKVV